MFGFFKKVTESLTGSRASLSGTDSATTSKQRDAQDTLASLGLDPTLLADNDEDDPTVDHDPDLNAALDQIQAAPAKAAARKAPAAAPAAKKPVGALADLGIDVNLDDVLADLDSDEEVELHEHELPELEAQLAALAELDDDEPDRTSKPAPAPISPSKGATEKAAESSPPAAERA
ncbi:hypothetical protein AMAG_12210 [Allomyces macrogynus ATCC 38327]|uniref:Uncharacterized protein n=1 Tax=Allomyces macrogynus (strain ATCC 38327) TaxID=578462 RepID=A0A0L0SXA4_ALLM3|nr:hypothetical protein AMAG_12210 [Allomyces macrogynus ATCC 38327]|eukprot:KNE67137.1 hypothetical protein AMAG_12210 [Allomyces macrogynus ATCC 38327]